MNKQVVRSVCKSPQVREVFGEAIFPKGIPTTTIVLEEFLSNLLLKPWKGSGEAEGMLRREGAHFLGWDRHVGNERL
jgi:hypothetical protein